MNNITFAINSFDPIDDDTSLMTNLNYIATPIPTKAEGNNKC